MSGRTGKRVGAKTRLLRINGTVFAVSESQANLHDRAVVAGGGCYAAASEVRSARKLESIGAGTLRDDGALGRLNDGERWWYAVKSAAFNETCRAALSQAGAK